MANSSCFQGSKIVAAAGTPVQAGLAGQKFGSVLIYGQKAKGSANTGIVYVGFGNLPAQPIAVGGSLSISIDPANGMSMADIWVDAATNGDGITFDGTQF